MSQDQHIGSNYRRGPGICTKVSLQDVKHVARIKAERISKGTHKRSKSVEVGDSDSSRRFKVAEEDKQPLQPQVSVSSVSPTSRVKILGNAIDVVFREDEIKITKQGVDGFFK